MKKKQHPIEEFRDAQKFMEWILFNIVDQWERMQINLQDYDIGTCKEKYGACSHLDHAQIRLRLETVISSKFLKGKKKMMIPIPLYFRLIGFTKKSK